MVQITQNTYGNGDGQ